MNNNSYTFHAEQGKSIGRFRIKVGQGEAGINNAEVALEKVIVSNNQILVRNNSGKTVALYTTDGKLIYETWETNAVFNVNSGVYIIKEGENTHKVVVP
jgi:outer membrane protein assembly factor BamB